MVTMDLDQIDLLARSLGRLSSDSEDVLGRLGMLNYEISGDTKLLLYPSCRDLLQNMSDAVDSLRIANEMLWELKEILSELPEAYYRIACDSGSGMTEV